HAQALDRRARRSSRRVLRFRAGPDAAGTARAHPRLHRWHLGGRLRARGTARRRLGLRSPHHVRPGSPRPPPPRRSATGDERGRGDQPLEVIASATDAFDVDGYRRLEDAGVTQIMTLPWLFYGGSTGSLAEKKEGIARFAEDVISRMPREPSGCSR